MFFDTSSKLGSAYIGILQQDKSLIFGDYTYSGSEKVLVNFSEHGQSYIAIVVLLEKLDSSLENKLHKNIAKKVRLLKVSDVIQNIANSQRHIVPKMLSVILDKTRNLMK